LALCLVDTCQSATSMHLWHSHSCSCCSCSNRLTERQLFHLPQWYWSLELALQRPAHSIHKWHVSSLIWLGDIKFLWILWNRDSSQKNLLEALVSCSCKELMFPRLPLILLSTEGSNLQVLLSNQAHLEGISLETINSWGSLDCTTNLGLDKSNHSLESMLKCSYNCTTSYSGHYDCLSTIPSLFHQFWIISCIFMKFLDLLLNFSFSPVPDLISQSGHIPVA